MFWALSAKDNGPCAHPTRRVVYNLVTLTAKTSFLITFLFNPLRTLSEMGIPQLSCYQRLPHSFTKTRGVGTPPTICLLFSTIYAVFANHQARGKSRSKPPPIPALTKCRSTDRSRENKNAPHGGYARLSARQTRPNPCKTAQIPALRCAKAQNTVLHCCALMPFCAL